MWQPQIETMGREEMRALQEKHFRQSWKHIWANAPAQRKLLLESGVRQGDVQSLDDLCKLPFTDKKAFTDNYPFGLFAVPPEDIVRFHSTSGTTSKPSMGGYTAADMNNWKNQVARAASMAGVTKGDTAHIAFGFGMFTGGFGLNYGLEHMGVRILPMGGGQTEKQLMMLKDIGATVLIATPSYALYLGEAVREAGIKGELKLRVGLFGGEGHTAEMAGQIEKSLGITATSNYGLCELGGPGLSGECVERRGMHIAEDHFYCEIIDPDTGRVLPDGEIGELVVTPLTREALPLIRYRTKDITKIMAEPCVCGRTHKRMSPTLGRSDDMLIIRGVNVFPSQIESILICQEHIGPHYMLYVRRDGAMDTLEVRVELTDGSVLDSYSALESVQGRIREQIKNILGLTVKVTLAAPQTLERFVGKAKRIVDER